MTAQVLEFAPEVGTRTATSFTWSDTTGIALDAELTHDGSASITGVTLTATTLSLVTSGGDLSEQLERGGTLTFRNSETAAIVDIWPAGDDEEAPYVWTLADEEATAAAAFLAAVEGSATEPTITLTLDDHVINLREHGFYVRQNLNLPDEPIFDRAYWLVAPGDALGTLSHVWFSEGATEEDRELNYIGVQRGGWIELNLNGDGAGFREDIAEFLQFEINASWPDQSLSLSLTVTGIGGQAPGNRSAYFWQTSNPDEVNEFFENSLKSEPSPATIEFRLVRTAHLTPSGVAVSGSATGATTTKIAPTIHATRAGAVASGAATSARTFSELVVQFTRAATVASGAAAGARTVKSRLANAGVAVSPSATGARARKVHDGSSGVSVSGSSVAVTTTKQIPLTKAATAGTVASPAAVGAASFRRIPTVPLAPRSLSASGIEQELAIISWDEPEGDGNSDLEPITSYEVQFLNGPWVATNTGTGRIYRLTSIGSVALAAGTSYRLRVRAVNSVGAGAPSDTLLFRSGAVLLSSEPEFLHVAAESNSVLSASWRVPRDLGGGTVIEYQTALIHPDGTIDPWEETDSAATSWRIRGLADGARYGVRVRAVNQGGAGAASETAFATTGDPQTIALATGDRLPLLPNVYRQSMIVRLQSIDCRVTVWWQPWDEAWYGSIEVPANTAVAQARRLAVNSGLLRRAVSDLDGDVVCRALDTDDSRVDPGENAWSIPTHGLFWEPAQ